jgi:hypothetical protein
MPLLDHFHPPWLKQRPWDSFHAAWANALAEQLNDGVLPPPFVALPLTHQGGRIEIDVATVNGVAGVSGGGTAMAVWAPPRPTLESPIDFTNLDVYEVRVQRDDDSPPLVAAIELVSPGNKDRASHRGAFAVKCAGYLQQGVGLVVVDVVTSRSANLHGELLELLGLSSTPNADVPPNLYAAAYRTTGPAEASRLESWWEEVALAAPLPKMPLWIMEEVCVPVDLEAAYSVARKRLVMR